MRLLHIGGISNSGLSELLSVLKEGRDDLGIMSSRASINAANMDRFPANATNMSNPVLDALGVPLFQPSSPGHPDRLNIVKMRIAARRLRASLWL